MPLVKYERDSMNLTGTLAESEISFAEQLTNGALVNRRSLPVMRCFRCISTFLQSGCSSTIGINCSGVNMQLLEFGRNIINVHVSL